ncbi:MAG: DUF4286 family protein [Bacteroidota bacterium]
MILFNVTCHIEKGIDADFLFYLKDHFQAQLRKSNFISDSIFLRLLTEVDDHSFTYSIQLRFENILLYQQFQLEEEELLLEEIQMKFVGKIFTFTTLLETI